MTVAEPKSQLNRVVHAIVAALQRREPQPKSELRRWVRGQLRPTKREWERGFDRACEFRLVERLPKRETGTETMVRLTTRGRVIHVWHPDG